MRNITKIVIHCADTYPRMDIDIKEIREWHVGYRGWKDVGYHYIITRKGEVQEGRPIEEMGAHVAGHNKDSIGICLVGGKFDKDNPNDELFTRAEFESLKDLLDDLWEQYPDAKVIGHCELDPKKECPCFDVQEWLKDNGIN